MKEPDTQYRFKTEVLSTRFFFVDKQDGNFITKHLKD